MIPPNRDLRLRSIKRWLTAFFQKQYAKPNQSEALDARAEEIDAEMMEEFEDGDILLFDKLSRGPQLEADYQRMQTDRLMLWQEIVANRLPVISDPNAVD